MADNLRIGLTVDAEQAKKKLSETAAALLGLGESAEISLNKLRAELTKSENNLAKFEAALKKATDVNEINYLQRNVGLLKDKVAVLKNEFRGFNVGADQASTSLINLGRVVQDAPFGFIGIANNIDPLLGSFQSLKRETGSVGGAFKALGGALLGGGGLAFAVSAVTSVLVVLQGAFGGSGQKAKEAKKEIDEYKQVVDGIIKRQADELANVNVLVRAFNEENKSREEKTAIIKRLQQLSPEYFNQLNAEKANVIDLTKAYNDYAQSIEKSVIAEIKKDKLTTILRRKIELQLDLGLEGDQGVAPFESLFNDIPKAAQKAAGYTQNFIRQNPFLPKNTQRESDSFLRSYQGKLDVLNKLSAEARRLEIELAKLEKVAIDPKRIENKKKDIEDILRRGLNLSLLDIVPVEPEPSTLDRIFAAMNKTFQDVGNDKRIKPIKLPFTVTQDGFAAERKKLEEFGKAGAQIFGDFFSQSFQGIGDALGKALVGDEGGITGLFTNIANLLGDSLKRLGQYIIETSTLVASIRNVLNAAFKGNPALGIAVGVGLIALGSAIQATLPKFANGVDNFRGGLAIVGERGPEVVNLPRGSDVIPNFRLNSLQPGGGTQVFIPDVRLRGQDIYLSFTRQQATNRRNGV